MLSVPLKTCHFHTVGLALILNNIHVVIALPTGAHNEISNFTQNLCACVVSGLIFFNIVAIMHILVSTKFHFPLTHWGWAMHICVCRLTIIVSDNGLLPGWLYQCWNIVNWTAGNRLQWNLTWNSYIFIKENVFECFDCEIAAIMSRPQCVNVQMYCWEMLWRCEHDESFLNAAKVGFFCCCWMSEIFNVLEKNFSTVSSNQGLYTAVLWQWI